MIELTLEVGKALYALRKKLEQFHHGPGPARSSGSSSSFKPKHNIRARPQSPMVKPSQSRQPQGPGSNPATPKTVRRWSSLALLQEPHSPVIFSNLPSMDTCSSTSSFDPKLNSVSGPLTPQQEERRGRPRVVIPLARQRSGTPTSVTPTEKSRSATTGSRIPLAYGLAPLGVQTPARQCMTPPLERSSKRASAVDIANLLTCPNVSEREDKVVRRLSAQTGKLTIQDKVDVVQMDVDKVDDDLTIPSYSNTPYNSTSNLNAKSHKHIPFRYPLSFKKVDGNASRLSQRLVETPPRPSSPKPYTKPLVKRPSMDEMMRTIQPCLSGPAMISTKRLDKQSSSSGIPVLSSSFESRPIANPMSSLDQKSSPTLVRQKTNILARPLAVTENAALATNAPPAQKRHPADSKRSASMTLKRIQDNDIESMMSLDSSSGSARTRGSSKSSQRPHSRVCSKSGITHSTGLFQETERHLRTPVSSHGPPSASLRNRTVSPLMAGREKGIYTSATAAKPDTARMYTRWDGTRTPITESNHPVHWAFLQRQHIKQSKSKQNLRESSDNMSRQEDLKGLLAAGTPTDESSISPVFLPTAVIRESDVSPVRPPLKSAQTFPVPISSSPFRPRGHAQLSSGPMSPSRSLLSTSFDSKVAYEGLKAKAGLVSFDNIVGLTANK